MNQAATPALSTLQRLKIDAELAGLARQRAGLTPGVPLFAFKVAQIAGKIVSLLRQRGVDLDAPKREREAFAPEGEPDVPEQPRVPTADFYEFDPNRKHSERKKDNAAAMALLRKIDAQGDGYAITAEEKRILAKYSGTGGNLVGADGLQGSAYEYYTPKPIAQGMWDLLGELGFKGGKVLDPCSGVGVFGACAPASVAMESVELNATSGRINQLVNGGPGYNAIVSPFEAVANRTDDEIYDAVVSNVPFGGVHDRGANRKIDPKYQDQPLETYFILRSLEKLKPGGLAAFIVPPRVVSAKGGTEEKLRLRASFMAEFMGAYRLPNSVFGTADADTITDVIVFRKFGRDAAQKIEELREQNPGALTEAKVLWQEFIGGMYFAGEGKRFVLGEFQAKDPTKFRDVDRIISDQSIPNIAKLMRKFPGSRIDWKALEAIETEPIVYAEGDTVTLAGQTLEMREGRWVAVGKAPESDRFDAIGAQLTNALSAVSNKVTWADADGYVQYLRGRSMDLEMPVWLRLAHNDIKGARGDEGRLWDTLAAALAAVEVTQEHSSDPTFNYLEAYPVLSEALQDTTMAAQKAPTSYSRESKAALTKARIVFSKKTGFSDLWQGKGQADVDVGTLDEDAQIGALQYRVGAAIDVADLKRVYGDGFDVMADEGWCLDATGTKAMKSDDYYAGNYADFLRRIDGEIAAADGPLRDKLLRQKLAAAERIELVDPAGLRFNLFSPFVTMEEKAEFLRRFMNPAFALAVNNLGEPYIVYEGKSDTTEQKLMSRIAAYLSGDAGGRGVRSLSLQGKDLGLTDREALVMLRQLAQRLNTQFDGWVKANPTITDRLQATANDPERLYFTEVDDNSPIDIPGMNPALKLHGYQNAYVRKQARSFGGINGYDVGLGKAQSLDSKIMTPDGWKRMGDMRVGDMVFSVDGKPVAVTGVYPQGEREIFEVEFSDGSKTECCEEHLWFTETEADRNRRRYRQHAGKDTAGTEGSVKMLKDIAATLIVSKKQKNHSIPMVAPIEFQERNFAIHPYLMGVLLGDGHMGAQSVEYTKSDTQISDRVCHLLKDGFGDSVDLHRVTNNSNRADTWKIRRTATSGENPVLDEVRSLGLDGLLSHQKFVPKQYMVGSVRQRIDLLHGLMDTDGYVSKDGMTVQFTSTSRMLADAVVEIVQSLGGIAWVSSKIPTYTYKGEKKQGRTAYTVSLRLSPSINPFSLQRKAERVAPRSKYLPVRYIVSVRSVGTKPAQCISVDHPSHLYVTDDYIVTHNTFTALACTQYVQSIGVKKKTVFVVPNSVLSNWRREASRAFTSTDDCLFIGLEVNEKTGKATVVPANYARDFTRVLENRHRKIFCTLEAFTSIPFKDETIARYEDHLFSVDPSYLPDPEKAKKADFERANSKLSDVTGTTGTKSSALPYFEDMGIDSIVSDEAHMFKNSKDTVDFSGAKFLSVSEASQRGRDMQMKAWYVRGMSPAADGVLALTATPITNSPLEIYSMLTLAVGEKKVHDLTMGIKGADAFLDAMCIIEDDEDVGIDGTVKSYRIFRGLQNVDLLRNALGSVATIKTAEDVKLAGDDLQLPESPENRTRVMLADATLERLTEYKMAYRAAKHLTGMAARDALPPTDEEVAAFERVQARLGEDPELIAHPFNLIQKMTALIADPEMDERASFYSIVPAQKALAETVIAAFNKLGRIEQRPRGGPWTEKEAVVGQKTIKDGGGEAVVLRIKVRAGFTPDGRIWVDTLDYATQLEFEKLADKNKLALDVSIPPKLASLLANVREEEASPRSASGRVKQLIFCDILPLHNKIKRILTQHAGIASSAIEIVSGRSIKNAEQMQGIQDGFNAEGEDNLYRAIIANEKAEVGINLQKGTQANHHLTSGWTPDSQHQRDGRSVRQGNTTKRVNIYKYHADGTFDEYKSTLVSSKADWINAVMDKQGGNEVQVAGGLSAEQYDELIESMGDANAMNAAQARAVLRDQMQRASSARQRQTISLQTAQSQLQFVKDYPTIKAWIKAQAGAAFDLNEQLKAMDKRNTANMKPETLIRFESRKAEMRAKLDGMLRDLDDAATYTEYRGNKLLSEAINERSSYIKTAVKHREAFVRLASSADNIKEDSVVAGDWGSQVAQAQAMADEAYKEFERIAGQGGGAFSARMLADFKEGRGRMVDGRPFVPGMFIRNGDSLYIVTEERNAMAAGGKSAYLTDAIRGGEVIGFESPDYDAAVAEAAAADDARNEVTEFTRDTLYSAHSADVAQRRKTVTMVKYRPNAILLPSPYFPHPVNPDWVANASDFVRGLARSQQAIIGRWEDGRCFISAAETVRDIGSTLDQTIVRNLSEYARGNGAKVTPEDIAMLLRGQALSAPAFTVYWGKLLRWPDTATSIERINAVTTIEELDLVQSAIIAEAADWLKLPANVQMTDVGGGAPSGITSAVFAKRAAIRVAQNPAPVPTPAIALPATGGAPAVNGIPVSPAGNIGLTGGTMDKVNSGGMSAAVKDFIKKAAEEAGARARWRGEKVQWDVTPAAWNVLTTKYPEAAQKLSVVPAAA